MHLITGGAGFIGSHIATQLVDSGEPVRVLDNFSTGRVENLAAVSGNVDVWEGDIRDGDVLRRALRGVDTVFHHAAIVSVARSIADPAETVEVNVVGTLNLLLAVRDAGWRRFVFASSSAVYGDSPEMPKTETMATKPQSPYAVSMASGEQLCAIFAELYGLETVSLRYFNVFGPRQDPDSAYAAVIPRFVAALLAGEAPVIYGDGEQSRDFVYVDDVVEANLRAATAPGISGRVFNIASGNAITINAVLGEIERLLDRHIAPSHQPPRPGDIRQSLANISAARRDLAFNARLPFDQGLARTVATNRTGKRPVAVGDIGEGLRSNAHCSPNWFRSVYSVISLDQVDEIT